MIKLRIDLFSKFKMLLLVLIAVICCAYYSCMAYNEDNPAITEYEVCQTLLKDWTGVTDLESCLESSAVAMATSKPPGTIDSLVNMQLLPCLQYQIGMRQCKKRSKVLPAGLFR